MDAQGISTDCGTPAWAVGSRELMPLWQSRAGQAAGKKGGPMSFKVAHKCGIVISFTPLLKVGRSQSQRGVKHRV